MSPKKLSTGIALIITSAFLFGLMNVLAKIAAHRLSFIEVGFFRCLLSLPFLVPYLISQKASFKLGHKRLMLLRSMVGWLAMMCTFYSLTHIAIADAAMLFNTAPIWVFIFAELVLKEKVPPIYWALIALAFVGVALILQPQLQIFNWGGVIGLVGGMLVGWVYMILKQLSKHNAPANTVLYFTLFSTLFYVPLLPGIWLWPTTTEWLLLIATAGLATAAQLMLTSAYQYGKAATISVYNYMNVITSAVFAWIILQENLSFTSITGIFILILTGVFISQYEEKLMKKIKG